MSSLAKEKMKSAVLWDGGNQRLGQSRRGCEKRENRLYCLRETGGGLMLQLILWCVFFLHSMIFALSETRSLTPTHILQDSLFIPTLPSVSDEVSLGDALSLSKHPTADCRRTYATAGGESDASGQDSVVRCRNPNAFMWLCCPAVGIGACCDTR